eukprot:CAMPEP_0169441680 /NCGR_PEP_ID=MMETSP1042-20121227/8402_1 /TAXON_ID=464988 /ORGANISM="Hemiselmis andersenii, Strain CCMP1180" /LENGTH=59 /DNA_ID=CAMNT_0009552759 /DNA_START=182 /DNA_END=358 /DNA_ORIENTATION=-
MRALRITVASSTTTASTTTPPAQTPPFAMLEPGLPTAGLLLLVALGVELASTLEQQGLH